VTGDRLRSTIALVSGLYLITAGLGTWLAVHYGLVGRPFGWDLDMAPLPGFLFGMGTALSAPLVLLFVLVAANVMLNREGRLARLGSGVVPVLGAGFLVGMLAEPITWTLVWAAQVDGPIAGVVFANILLPILLIVLPIVARSKGGKAVIQRRPAAI
jgi:hypothetical protein